MKNIIKALSEARRRDIFATLVEVQDAGANVPDSRALVATRHSISVEDVRRIEQEGLDGDWPPLE